MGGQTGFQFTSINVAFAKSIYWALAAFGVNAKQAHVLDAAQGLFFAETKDLFKAFQDSVLQDQDATPMSHNDFLVGCVANAACALASASFVGSDKN